MLSFGPTHWTVRPDVRQVADRVSRRFGASWNTYADHPPGMGLDAVSVDFWARGGRGENLGRLKRRRIARYLRRGSAGIPWRWIINGRRGYLPDGRRFTPPGGAVWNAGHVHVTFR